MVPNRDGYGGGRVARRLACSRCLGRKGFPDRLAAVTLRVADRAGELSGVVIFYVNQDEEIVGAEERPIVHPRFENDVLTFEVTRSGDGQPLRFHMKLTTSGAGELTGEGQSIKMKKVE